MRRRRAVRPGDVVLAYTDRIGGLLWTTAGLGLVEITVVDLLAPWATMRRAGSRDDLSAAPAVVGHPCVDVRRITGAHPPRRRSAFQ
jgi:hypothetical protein